MLVLRSAHRCSSDEGSYELAVCRAAVLDRLVSARQPGDLVRVGRHQVTADVLRDVFRHAGRRAAYETEHVLRRVDRSAANVAARKFR